MSDKDRLFPGAPPDATLSEEGWLLYGQEAWTRADWFRFPSLRPGRTAKGGRPRIHATEEARVEAKRRNDQESYRRRYQLRKDAEMRLSA